MIRIQSEALAIEPVLAALEDDAPAIGAVCSFTGLARDLGDQSGVQSLFLEHYPGMTETAIQAVVDEADRRWTIHRTEIVHRVGEIRAGERIVFVGVSSRHRQDAFEACQFIMDYLKTRAPFWKKEITAAGNSDWVEQKASDREAARRWADSDGL
ncbi:MULTISPECIES: molybdenum cofactor biosynthesis protein MoaE [Gammaproteobacteria]|jgi:molybdopterin synthase catalytic subunit|uniref:Molybdopterin synthase catalytic subunit n=1 Tax=Vreelandella halophila TaxID=86177 RepID=A0A9X4YBR2_9GAMM|nr:MULTISPECIES: molybdenum cofactor biosynthesis protein MoaE [Gammaproteobacteria]KAA8981300.1 molybdenum cofactor biosynthesis protein MoaE [Halospina sp. K52047b]MYL26153.1 molybdenum cofactor biosynthesis protein MoaE [Halomonas utahensis]MYL73285.1 molybdenum cofactor biosynthesis protein MoaE [Halomonas sp. 22501_18_FS]